MNRSRKSDAVYDVVIVGAGPAGSAAATFLALVGARVALVDGARFPRPKACAGWVNAKAAREFRFVKDACRKVKAATFKRLVFHSPDLAATAEFSSRSVVGYLVRRENFDAELVRAARGAGAKTILGTKAVTVEIGEREAAAVLADGRRIAGRILIGADGVHSTVARAAGLRDRWPDGQQVVCLEKRVPLAARQRKTCFRDGAIHMAPAFGQAMGYAWAFPGADYVNVGVGVRTGEGPPLAALYEAWVAGLRSKGFLPAEAETDGPEGGIVPAGAALEYENQVGKRLLLIGDAGGFAAAASGEGIYPAIRSAALASRCVLAALQADRGEKKGSTCQDELLQFRRLWREQLAAYLQMPNVNVAFLLPLIYTNQEIADRFARAFLFGENL